MGTISCRVISEVPLSDPARRVAPGGALRFALAGGDGTRSATWRIWTSKNNPDIYIAARTSAGVLKASLHRSGSWQYGFVSDEKAVPWIEPGGSRHIDIWTQPAEMVAGWTRAFTLIIPDSELRRWPADEPPETGDVVLLPPVGRGYALHVEVMLAGGGGASAIVIDDSYDIGEMLCSDGSCVRVIGRRAVVEPGQRAWFAAKKLEALNLAPAELVDAAGMPRLALFGNQHDEAATRCIWEAAASGARYSEAP